MPGPIDSVSGEKGNLKYAYRIFNEIVALCGGYDVACLSKMQFCSEKCIEKTLSIKPLRSEKERNC